MDTSLHTDYEGWPLLPLDSIPRIASQTLLLSRSELHALLAALHEDGGADSLERYAEQQLRLIDQELLQRNASRRLGSLLGATVMPETAAGSLLGASSVVTPVTSTHAAASSDWSMAEPWLYASYHAYYSQMLGTAAAWHVAPPGPHSGADHAVAAIGPLAPLQVESDAATLHSSTPVTSTTIEDSSASDVRRPLSKPSMRTGAPPRGLPKSKSVAPVPQRKKPAWLTEASLHHAQEAVESSTTNASSMESVRIATVPPAPPAVVEDFVVTSGEPESARLPAKPKRKKRVWEVEAEERKRAQRRQEQIAVAAAKAVPTQHIAAQKSKPRTASAPPSSADRLAETRRTAAETPRCAPLQEHVQHHEDPSPAPSLPPLTSSIETQQAEADFVSTSEPDFQEQGNLLALHHPAAANTIDAAPLSRSAEVDVPPLPDATTSKADPEHSLAFPSLAAPITVVPSYEPVEDHRHPPAVPGESAALDVMHGLPEASSSGFIHGNMQVEPSVVEEDASGTVAPAAVPEHVPVPVHATGWSADAAIAARRDALRHLLGDLDDETVTAPTELEQVVPSTEDAHNDPSENQPNENHELLASGETVANTTGPPTISHLQSSASGPALTGEIASNAADTPGTTVADEDAAVAEASMAGQRQPVVAPSKVAAAKSSTPIRYDLAFRSFAELFTASSLESSNASVAAGGFSVAKQRARAAVRNWMTPAVLQAMQTISAAMKAFAAPAAHGDAYPGGAILDVIVPPAKADGSDFDVDDDDVDDDASQAAGRPLGAQFVSLLASAPPPVLLAAPATPLPLRYFRIAANNAEVAALVRRAVASDPSWVEVPPEVDRLPAWNLMWSWGKPPVQSKDLLTWQRVNHFKRARELSRKDLLKRNLARYHVLGARMSAAFALQPPTFLLPQEYLEFANVFGRGVMHDADATEHALVPEDALTKLMRAMGAHGVPQATLRQTGPAASPPSDVNIWILKPAGLSRGRGISLVTDIKQVQYADDMVIQKYIHNPLLLDGYKFDLRLYVLVTSFSPLEAFLYRRGFARISSRPFSMDAAAIADKFIHLTNSSVQRHNAAAATTIASLPGATPSAVGGTKCSLEYLWQRLVERGVDTAALWESIRDLVIKSLVCVDDVIPHQPNSFEVYGYDVLIDSNMKPWLIEVNASPSLGVDSALDVATKTQLIIDTVALVDPLPFDRAAVATVIDKRLAASGALSRSTAGRIRMASAASAGPTAEDSAMLNEEINSILHGALPRPVGAPPRCLGAYERLCPDTPAYNRVMQLKFQHFRAAKRR